MLHNLDGMVLSFSKGNHTKIQSAYGSDLLELIILGRK
jgi:hypothetical protein